MRRLIQTTALCVALATSAQADITYQGRDAQGLHCAAMLTVVAAQLSVLGMMDDATVDKAATLAAIILVQLPGTEDQIGQALGQRADKLMKTRNTRQLLEEFNSTSKWCARNFLS